MLLILITLKTISSGLITKLLLALIQVCSLFKDMTQDPYYCRPLLQLVVMLNPLTML